MVEFGYEQKSWKLRGGIFELFFFLTMKPFTTHFLIEDLNHETPIF
jgi:hypothetical protein